MVHRSFATIARSKNISYQLVLLDQRKRTIQNNSIREKIGVAPIVKKMTKNWLRWFGHVQRRPPDAQSIEKEERETIKDFGGRSSLLEDNWERGLKCLSISLVSVACTNVKHENQVLHNCLGHPNYLALC
ncbi:hypothetical protein CR513_21528, partial [Mucuna pruriens]